MRKPTITPATLRDALYEVLAEGAWTPHMSTAEQIAVEYGLAAALTPLVTDRATREDVREYLHQLETADDLEKDMPQQYQGDELREAWCLAKDTAEYRIAAIGQRIVGTL